MPFSNASRLVELITVVHNKPDGHQSLALVCKAMMGKLFPGWTPLAWWAPLLALPAAVYVDLLEATFKMHRHVLYQSLRCKPPVNPAKETPRW